MAFSKTIGVFALAAAVAGCGARAAGSPPLVQPGAPGEAPRAITAAKAADQSRIQYTDVDVKFMQGMIHHHAQAVDMAALIPDRTASDAMRKLGMRIDVSQQDEIRMMQQWLEVRRQDVPGPHAHHMPGAPLMPGMLTPDEMARLAAAKGAAFDQLFLEGMIKHHAGALAMVRDLFAARGAGQEADIYAFASDVDADQRMEIDRMTVMLREMGK